MPHLHLSYRSLLHSSLVIKSASWSSPRTGGERREGTGRAITHQCTVHMDYHSHTHVRTHSSGRNNVWTPDNFRSISGSIWSIVFRSGKMSTQRKCRLEESSVVDLDAPCSDPPTKKRSVQKKTVEKWVVENDKELNTSVWLKFETAAGDRERVATLKYAVCSRFRERLQPMRNYRPAFIEGTSNVRTSTFKDHADTDSTSTLWFFLRRHNLAGLANTH